MFTYCKQLRTVMTREDCKKCPRFPSNEKEPGVYACHPTWTESPIGWIEDAVTKGDE